jgi:hypothetical protein
VAREEPAHHFPDLAELARASDEGKVAERALHVGLALEEAEQVRRGCDAIVGILLEERHADPIELLGSVGWIVRGGLTAWCRCFSR